MNLSSGSNASRSNAFKALATLFVLQIAKEAATSTTFNVFGMRARSGINDAECLCKADEELLSL